MVPTDGWRSSRGCAALVLGKYRGHPLCYGTHPALISPYSYAGENVIPGHYRDDRKGNFSLYHRCPETLYSGWFVNWDGGWIPALVEAETAEWPVLLVKTDGLGAWVSSTMRLTSRSATPLVRNIVFFGRFRDLWVEYHNRTITRRRRNDIATGAALALCLIAACLFAIRHFGVKHLLEVFSPAHVAAVFSWLHIVGGLSVAAALVGCWEMFCAWARRPIGHPKPIQLLWNRVAKWLIAVIRHHGSAA